MTLVQTMTSYATAQPKMDGGASRMSDRLIFVSCGQKTEQEKNLGSAVQVTIDSHEGFKAYFADSVQTLDALSHNVFDSIRRCAGAVVLLHERGEDGRSSMWINQEVAMLAYRQFFESVDIPILVFKEATVKLEGAMTAFIVNPKPLSEETSVIQEVRKWLKDRASKGPRDEQAAFDQKWSALESFDRLILKALIEEGGQNVKETSIRQRIRTYGLDANAVSSNLQSRRPFLSHLNLARLHQNIYDGDEMSLHPAWQWYVRHAVAQMV